MILVMTRCTRLSAVSWLVLLVEVELFSPSCQCYKLNYVLLRTKTGWQTISQNYNFQTSKAQHFNSLQGKVSFPLPRRKYLISKQLWTQSWVDMYLKYSSYILERDPSHSQGLYPESFVFPTSGRMPHYRNCPLKWQNFLKTTQKAGEAEEKGQCGDTMSEY